MRRRDDFNEAASKTVGVLWAPRRASSTQPLPLFLSVPPPFSLCAGKLIY